MVNRKSLWVFVVVLQFAASPPILGYAAELGGEDRTGKIRDLTGRLRDASLSDYSRISAAQALAAEGKAALFAVPDLIDVLESGLAPDEVRCAVAEALAKLASAGDKAQLAVTPLIEVLNDVLEPEELRCAAARALGEFGAATEKVVPALMKALRAGQPTALHSAAAAALAKMPSARVDLLKAMCDRSQPTDVRLIAGEALGHMDLARDQAFAGEAMLDLLALLKDTAEAADIRYAAACTAGNMGALDELRTLFQDKDSGTCFGAALGLATIARQDMARNGSQHSEAFKVLQGALEAGDWWLRYAAAEALAEMGPAAAGATPKLAARLGDEDVWVRHAAAKALAHIGQDALDELEHECAGDKPAKVRRAAAEALRMMVGTKVDGLKSALKKVIAEEEKLEDKSDPRVRRTAREALEQLERAGQFQKIAEKTPAAPPG